MEYYGESFDWSLFTLNHVYSEECEEQEDGFEQDVERNAGISSLLIGLEGEMEKLMIDKPRHVRLDSRKRYAVSESSQPSLRCSPGPSMRQCNLRKRKFKRLCDGSRKMYSADWD